MVGAGNSHFKTGTSYSAWFAAMRPLIRARDGDACVPCSRLESKRVVVRKGLVVLRTNLLVHHISEDVTDNTAENLVTVCDACHMVHHKSHTTPWPWFAEYAATTTAAMDSEWTESVRSLRERYSGMRAHEEART